MTNRHNSGMDKENRQFILKIIHREEGTRHSSRQVLIYFSRGADKAGFLSIARTLIPISCDITHISDFQHACGARMIDEK